MRFMQNRRRSRFKFKRSFHLHRKRGRHHDDDRPRDNVTHANGGAYRRDLWCHMVSMFHRVTTQVNTINLYTVPLYCRLRLEEAINARITL